MALRQCGTLVLQGVVDGYLVVLQEQLSHLALEVLEHSLSVLQASWE
jgi:hypothetical protein